MDSILNKNFHSDGRNESVSYKVSDEGTQHSITRVQFYETPQNCIAKHNLIYMFCALITYTFSRSMTLI